MAAKTKHTFKYLMKQRGKLVTITKTEEITRVKAIHYHCLDCSGGSMLQVRQCNITKCPLYPWRSAAASKRNNTNDL